MTLQNTSDEIKEYYYKNGSVRSQFTFNNEELNGQCRGWNEIGQLAFEGNWHNGKKHGVWSIYEENAFVINEYWHQGKKLNSKQEYERRASINQRNLTLNF